MREHGTRARYIFGAEGGDRANGCRCEECKAANSAYQAERSRRVAPPFVGADSARQHIRMLMLNGVGMRTIADRSGVPRSVIQKIMGIGDRTPTKRVRLSTRDRILAVQPIDRADGAKVPAAPTWRIVEQLLDRGWTKAAISKAIGQGGRALQLGGQYVTAGNAKAVAALLDAPVPARRSRHGLHPVPQLEVEGDDVDTLPDDLPAPPAIDLTTMPWRRQAACRMPDVPVWIFFPGRGDSASIAAAQSVCQRCASRADCLEAHLDEREGIWGGTTAAERRRIRKERGRVGPQHGTRSRYQAGCRCDDCRSANRDYVRDHYGRSAS